MTEGNAVDVEGLVKRFGAFIAAVDGLDLAVRTDEVHGFLGPNGAGKSTTIRVLLGLYRATAGRVRVLARPCAQQDAFPVLRHDRGPPVLRGEAVRQHRRAPGLAVHEVRSGGGRQLRRRSGASPWKSPQSTSTRDSPRLNQELAAGHRARAAEERHRGRSSVKCHHLRPFLDVGRWFDHRALRRSAVPLTPGPERRGLWSRRGRCAQPCPLRSARAIVRTGPRTRPGGSPPCRRSTPSTRPRPSRVSC
jgi:energy-coupling factor transporter ATP-binding protein EcfA2